MDIMTSNCTRLSPEGRRSTFLRNTREEKIRQQKWLHIGTVVTIYEKSLEWVEDIMNNQEKINIKSREWRQMMENHILVIVATDIPTLRTQNLNPIISYQTPTIRDIESKVFISVLVPIQKKETFYFEYHTYNYKCNFLLFLFLKNI